MKLTDATRTRTRRALEEAAQECRAAHESDRDSILAARRALRQAEKLHDEAIAQAKHDVTMARQPAPVAAYGHSLILYDDRLSTPERTHALTPEVRARFEERDDGSALLAVDGPSWHEQVEGPAGDAEALRELARAIDLATREVDAVRAAREPDTSSAEERLAAAEIERAAVEEAKPLLTRLEELTEEGECVLDMAPGITTGHDGVLVVTDRRLLFVGLRHTFSLPYADVRSVTSGGRFFGARLVIAAAGGKFVISGMSAHHAPDIAELARERLDALSNVG